VGHHAGKKKKRKNVGHHAGSKVPTLGTTISNVDILDILVPDARSRLQGRSVHQATKRDVKKRKMDDTAAEKVLA
jgi:hypothetical protein